MIDVKSYTNLLFLHFSHILNPPVATQPDNAFDAYADVCVFGKGREGYSLIWRAQKVLESLLNNLSLTII